VHNECTCSSFRYFMMGHAPICPEWKPTGKGDVYNQISAQYGTANDIAGTNLHPDLTQKNAEELSLNLTTAISIVHRTGNNADIIVDPDSSFWDKAWSGYETITDFFLPEFVGAINDIESARQQLNTKPEINPQPQYDLPPIERSSELPINSVVSAAIQLAIAIKDKYENDYYIIRDIQKGEKRGAVLKELRKYHNDFGGDYAAIRLTTGRNVIVQYTSLTSVMIDKIYMTNTHGIIMK